MTDFINNPEFVKAVLDDRIILIVMVIFLLRFKYATYNNIWLTALVNIPGTIFHELAHFIIGMIFNARPVKISILPKKNPDGGYTIGSVSFANLTFYNAIPACLAPLLLLPFAYFVDKFLAPHIIPTFLNYIIYVVLQTIIIENAIPSKKDLELAFSKGVGVLLYTTIGVAVFLYFKRGIL